MTTSSFLGPHRADVEPALDHLFAALSDPASNIRAIAAYTLGQYGDQSATVALLRVLSDPDAMVREEAAYALGSLEDVGSVAGLMVACDDPDETVRRTAADALDKLRPLLRSRPVKQPAEPMPRTREWRWTHARIAWMDLRDEPRQHETDRTGAPKSFLTR